MRRFRSCGFRTAVFPLVSLPLLLLAAPRPAEASWAAMLTQVGYQIQEAIDIWERHTRIVEDHFDHVAGLNNALSDINRTYLTVRGTLSTLGIGSRAPRLGDLYRAGFVDDRCLTYDSVGTLLGCELRDFAGGEFHQFEWHIRNLPGALSGSRNFSAYERAVRRGWQGQFPRVPSGPLGDRLNNTILGVDPSVVPSRRLQAATVRGRELYHAGRRRARRIAAAMDYGRRAASQMLDQPGRAGPVTDDFADCNAISDAGMTVLVAALRADCTRSTASNSDPRGGADSTANLSETEARQIAVQVQITETMLAASELELALLDYEGRLAAQVEAADLRREALRRSSMRFSAAAGDVPGCVTYAYAAECAAGYVQVETPAADQARADLFASTF